MKKRILIGLILAALIGALLPASAAEAPTVLGILEIRGLDSMAESAAELAAAVGKPMPQEMVSMILYAGLGTMPGMGIQRSGSLRAILMQGDGPEPVTAILLPVDNEGNDYLAGLAAAGWANDTETADEILHMTGPAEAGTAWKEAYFLKRGTTLVAGQTANAVRQADAALGSLPPILPVEGDVAIQIRPSAAISAYSTELDGMMDKSLQAAPGQTPEGAELARIYLEAYLAVGRQIESLVLGLGVADGNLNIHQRIAPAANTTLAKYMASIGSPSEKVAVVNLPDALYVETADLGNINLLAPAYFRFLENVMTAMPKEAETESESLENYIENAKTYWAHMGGDFGLALLPPTTEHPLRLAEYFGLKDALSLRNLTLELVSSANDMMQGMMDSPEMPIGIELSTGEAREFRDIPIDSVTYGIKPGAELAKSWPEGVPTQITAEIAWLADSVLISVGPTEQMDGLIDRLLDGTAVPLTARSEWKAAYPIPDPKLMDMTHIALFDIIRDYMGVIAEYSGEADTGAAMIPDSPGNLESASYMALGGLMTRFRFSLADIAAVAAKVQEVQQAQREAQAAFMLEMQREMEAMDNEDFQSMDEEEYEEWTAEEVVTEPVNAPETAVPVEPAP